MADPVDPVADFASMLHGDAVVAVADLAGRCGAAGLEVGWVHDDVPVEEAGWYATASFKGARITEQDHRSPSGAALALAERLLAGGQCRCGKTTTLADDRPEQCRWRLMGKRWEPGCDAPPIRVAGQRGDLAAMQAAVAAAPNRAARRRAGKRGGPGPITKEETSRG